MTTLSTDVLFRPFALGGLTLPNRIAMAPMTRSFSPGGVPGADVAAYYRRRAEGGVGLIITEGIYPPHASAGFDPNVPHLYGDAALTGWRNVVREVHAGGGQIFAQIWHTGRQISGPEPVEGGPQPVGPGVPAAEVDAIVAAYGAAAHNAQQCGFDGVEIHGAHGYLPHQFLMADGDARFAREVAAEIRRRVGLAFPVCLRFSQWHLSDYNAKFARTPEELGRILAPLTEAGVDLYHCSTRRFWEAEFEGSPLGLAAWVRKLTGKPVIAVGSVTLGTDVMTTFTVADKAPVEGLDGVLERMARDEFDLIAIGRALLANPEWANIVRTGDFAALRPFDRAVLATLF